MTMPPLPALGDNSWRDDWGQAVHNVATAVMEGRLTEAALRADLVARDEVDDVVATALAADSTPVTAAAAAVSTALSNANIPVVLVEGGPRPSSLTVLEGSPTFAAGKFGNAETGARLNQQVLTDPSPGVWTHELWARAAAHPAGNVVLLSLSGSYIGLGPDGHVYLGFVGTTGGPDICDNAWHHLAMVGISPVSGNSSASLWVDGARIASAVDLGNAGGFNDWTFGGFKDTSSAAATGVSFDSHRASYAPIGSTPRYTGASFTPPATAPAWDATTVALSPLDSLTTTAIGDGYPPRPNLAPGLVTYRGTVTPTDMLTRDQWEKQ